MNIKFLTVDLHIQYKICSGIKIYSYLKAGTFCILGWLHYNSGMLNLGILTIYMCTHFHFPHEIANINSQQSFVVTQYI